MPSSAIRGSLYRQACTLALYILVAAAAFHGSYNKWHFAEAGQRGHSLRGNVESILDGTADRPFIYRQLLPAAANFLDRTIPKPWLESLFAHQGSDPPGPLEALADSPTTRNPAYFYRYLLLYTETYLSALAALCAMHLLLKELASQAIPLSPITTHLAPTIVLLLVPYFQSAGGYYYDYPELAFLVLAAYIALRREWVWLLPLSALATLNKESFILFLPTLYPLLRRRHARAQTTVALTVTALVCIAVYLPIRAHFSQNHGAPLEFHLREQIAYFLDLKTLLFGTESTYGIRVLKAFSVLPLALLFWTVLRRWMHLPRAIKRHAQMAALINVPLYLLFCWPSEMRDLGLLYPTLLILLASNLEQQPGTAT